MRVLYYVIRILTSKISLDLFTFPLLVLIVLRKFLIICDLRTSISSCLIIAAYKKKVDKLKLVEVTDQICYENERFSI